MWMRHRWSGQEVELPAPADPGDPEYQSELNRRMQAGFRQIPGPGEELDPCNCGGTSEPAAEEGAGFESPVEEMDGGDE